MLCEFYLSWKNREGSQKLQPLPLPLGLAGWSEGPRSPALPTALTLPRPLGAPSLVCHSHHKNEAFSLEKIRETLKVLKDKTTQEVPRSQKGNDGVGVQAGQTPRLGPGPSS